MGPAPKADAECVRVVVRCRPLNSKETADGRARIIEMDKRQGQVTLQNKADAGSSKEPPKAFTFDAVFDWESTQREVYENTAAGIVNSTLEGYNGTVFAYGQTGTGKTHTMEGYSADSTKQGIIPQAFDHIFKAIEASADTQYLVRASFLEIYNEEIRDLLSKSPKDKLELKEHKDSGVYVKGLNAFVVKSVPEIKNVLEVRLSCKHARAIQRHSFNRQHYTGSVAVVLTPYVHPCVLHALAGQSGCYMRLQQTQTHSAPPCHAAARLARRIGQLVPR
jgi:kinesin family protein 3/17